MKIFKLFLFSVFLMSNIQVFSQTKLISHKSHSGSSSTFHKAMINDINLKSSNFGIIEMPFFTVVYIDTIKYVSDTLAEVSFSNMQIDRYTDSILDVIYFNHPVLIKVKNYEIDKKVKYYNYIKSFYTAENDSIETVIFIGFNENNENSNFVLPYFSFNNTLYSKLLIFSFLLSILLVFNYIDKRSYVSV